VFEEDDSAKQQAIFLMHDGEYTPWVMNHFKPLGPLEYYLEHFDQEFEVTQLRQGIDPEWYEFTAWAEYKSNQKDSKRK